MRIAVVDGQGGGIGKAIVVKLRAAGINTDMEIIALGTNATATSLMLKAGANEGATGENAIMVNAPKADIIIGSVAIIAPNAMMGELTPLMAKAVAESPAEKILLPLNRYKLSIAGIKNMPLLHYIDEGIEMIKSRWGGNEDV